MYTLNTLRYRYIPWTAPSSATDHDLGAFLLMKPLERAVLRIRIRIRIRLHEIRMFFDLSDQHPDPLVTRTDPARDRSIFHHKAKIVRKTSISIVLWLLFDLLSLQNDVNVLVFRIRIRKFLGLPDPLVRGTDPRTGSASRSVPKCNGSATLPLGPDLHSQCESGSLPGEANQWGYGFGSC